VNINKLLTILLVVFIITLIANTYVTAISISSEATPGESCEY